MQYFITHFSYDRLYFCCINLSVCLFFVCLFICLFVCFYIHSKPGEVHEWPPEKYSNKNAQQYITVQIVLQMKYTDEVSVVFVPLQQAKS
jgi:hypothetical protein